LRHHRGRGGEEDRTTLRSVMYWDMFDSSSVANVTLRARPHARRAREPAGGASVSVPQGDRPEILRRISNPTKKMICKTLDPFFDDDQHTTPNTNDKLVETRISPSLVTPLNSRSVDHVSEYLHLTLPNSFSK